MNRPGRQRALSRQVARLQGRIARLRSRSQRFTWYRLGAFLAGGFLTWIGVTRAPPPWSWLATALSLAGFTTVALLHRRLNRWIDTFERWAEIKSGHLARMVLDWERMPAPPSPATRRSLAIDLDLTGRRSLHHLIDLTLSRQGGQRLARWLSLGDPEPDDIQARQGIVRELEPLSTFRDRLLLAFQRVSKEQLEGQVLLDWLRGADPTDTLKWTLPVAAGLVAGNLTLFALNSVGQLPAYWPITFLLYAGFYYYNASRLETFLEATVDLDRELGKFKAILVYLEKYPYQTKGHLRRACRAICDPETRPSRQLRKIKLATAAVGLRMNPVLSLLLNFILPWDFFFAYLATRYKGQMARLFPVWLETLYNLEALISLANFAYLNPDYTFPEIKPDADPVLQVRAMGHPLIPSDRKVANDFRVNRVGEIAIITGSNMAGKSTFIKTLGVNLCLAYAGGPVDADRFQARPFRLHTCIRISDSITDGLSYFYAEVKCLKRLLESLEGDRPWPLLYLIDEIFRGTNNQERMIGSRAYVRALIGREGVGFVATHDLELTHLADLSPDVHNYHFRDHIIDGKMGFDYRLHPGPCPTTNALRLMALEGLPVDESGPKDAR
jgi:hypothetical protein